MIAAADLTTAAAASMKHDRSWSYARRESGRLNRLSRHLARGTVGGLANRFLVEK